METNFVTSKISKMLDDLQYNERCLAFFDQDDELILLGKGLRNSDLLAGMSAPLWQQVIDWFIVTYKFQVIFSYGDFAEKWAFQLNPVEGGRKPPYRSDYIYSYEEARGQAILKAIELISKP